VIAMNGKGKAVMSTSRSRGFTLVELMIVVAIVAILAAIAYPSYSAYVQRSRRAQAKADLTQLAQDLERQYTVQKTYIGYAPDGGFPTNSPHDGGVTAYTIDAVLQTRAYVLTATMAGPQTTDLCGNLTLDQTGQKHHSAGDEATCAWGTAGP
jgi:type IV pilus assembly protein PilE